MGKTNSTDILLTEQDAKRFLNHFSINPTSECWEWTASRIKDTYGNFSIKQNGKCRHILAHRYSYALHKEQPKELFVLHSCDNQRCVNPAHLFLGTHDDNMRDKVKKNRCSRLYGDKNPTRIRPEKVAKGEKVNLAKLTASQVAEIRRLYATGKFKQVELAQRFGVIQITISCIVRRKTWKHIL